MIRLAAVLTLLAAPVLAQDLQYTDRGTQSCLEQAESYGAKIDCAGASAGQCMEDTPGGHSTVGMGGCLDRELAYWDGLLNSHYKVAMAQAKNLDAERPASMKGLPGAAAALREMQRAWIPFRDKACAYEASLWSGGTGQGPAALSCLMQQTAKQTLTLEPWG
ncbi:lysozyme inhibitor LprI family protein [Sulfitobacter sp.]|uniref:lysozyme inhibitor LprI family protein n=1 Tax=Sulfitobacter sp. TaxID=1903071 RepID=UPI00356271A1